MNLCNIFFCGPLTEKQEIMILSCVLRIFKSPKLEIGRLQEWMSGNVFLMFGLVLMRMCTAESLFQCRKPEISKWLRSRIVDRRRSSFLKPEVASTGALRRCRKPGNSWIRKWGVLGRCLKGPYARFRPWGEENRKSISEHHFLLPHAAFQLFFKNFGCEYEY